MDPIRPGETVVGALPPSDAALVFIGRIATPWVRRADCPRQGHPEGPECRLMVDPVWKGALDGIDAYPMLQILYWMHEARRDLLKLVPSQRHEPIGVFARRAPTRPNPIASAIVRLVRRDGIGLIVRGLDCLDGTPLLDIKPWRGQPDIAATP